MSRLTVKLLQIVFALLRCFVSLQSSLLLLGDFLIGESNRSLFGPQLKRILLLSVLAYQLYERWQYACGRRFTSANVYGPASAPVRARLRYQAEAAAAAAKKSAKRKQVSLSPRKLILLLLTRMTWKTCMIRKDRVR